MSRGSPRGVWLLAVGWPRAIVRMPLVKLVAADVVSALVVRWSTHARRRHGTPSAARSVGVRGVANVTLEPCFQARVKELFFQGMFQSIGRQANVDTSCGVRLLVPPLARSVFSAGQCLFAAVPKS